ncbi:YqhA family protein [bacterium]|nr:YqhA family protein [bacterium]
MAGMKKIRKVNESILEHMLWNSRVIILLGVFGLIAGSTVMFIMGFLDTIALIKKFFVNIARHGIHFDAIYDSIIVSTIKIVDDFLLGIVLLIFGLGTYDLFISRLDPAEQQTDVRPDWLIFSSIDELKSVLGKVILMILIINLLKYALHIDYHSPSDLIYLGGAIALVAIALKFSHGLDINFSTLAKRSKAGTGRINRLNSKGDDS